MEYIIVLDIKEKHNFKLFYYIHSVEIPTSKGANSYKLKLSKIGNLAPISTVCLYLFTLLTL